MLIFQKCSFVANPVNQLQKATNPMSLLELEG